MNSLFSLEGKTALVTGASRGLGQAMAHALARAGADVVCTSTRLEGTKETAELIRSRGRRVWRLAADLSTPDGVRRLVEAAEAEAPPIDILVNNAGTIRRHPAVDHSLEEWDLVIATDLTAVFLLAQAFGRGMIERGGGKIINTASLLSFSGGINVPGYTASKHGVAGLTKALANEWARHNVQVNAIAPGYFATDVTEALRDDPGRYQEILARIPAGRWGTPEDLAGAAVFLASRASDYVTGHILTVDGGWMAR